MQVLRSLRRVGIVARGEAFRTGGSFNKKTTAIMLVMGLAIGFLTPHLTQNGVSFDHGLYRVAVAGDSPLLPAVQGSRLFRLVDVQTDVFRAVDLGDADLAIQGKTVYAPDTQKGTAALAALKQAAKDYTFSNLLLEPDEAAAFPVRVDLQYVAQARNAGSGSAPTISEPSIPTTATPTPGNTGTATGSGAQGQAQGQAQGSTPVSQAPSKGFSLLPPERSVNTPEALSPPFPFRSLLLAYVFLIPMNFIVQVYAGSAIGERLQRRGEALLASPARPWEIIAGKALPYFVGMMAVSAVITYFIGGSWLTLLAIAPLALTFLALEFVSAMFARSFRELTFLTVFTSVLLTIYAFLPAVFTSVHPIALVSPIALVVFDLRHDAVTFGQILYATMPLTLFSGMLFVIGGALYDEEDLFHQKPVLAKAVDAIARQVKSMGSAIKLSFLLIPLVFVVELLLITFLFAWPVSVGMVGVLLAVALVEEAFKAIPSYAGVRRGRVKASHAAIFGTLVGLGFFLAEKGFLLASLVGLLDVPAAAAVFGTSGAGVSGATPWFVVALLLLGPLLLHMGTATLTGWGAQGSRQKFAMSFVLAVLIHTLYNLLIITGLFARVLTPGGG